MTKFKTALATTIGILGAIILTPFVALFGLMMLGLAFGLSLFAAGAVAVMAHRAEAAEQTDQAQPAV